MPNEHGEIVVAIACPRHGDSRRHRRGQVLVWSWVWDQVLGLEWEKRSSLHGAWMLRIQREQQLPWQRLLDPLPERDPSWWDWQQPLACCCCVSLLFLLLFLLLFFLFLLLLLLLFLLLLLLLFLVAAVVVVAACLQMKK